MENNLYYTPTLNEFYIGFECEILGIIGAKEDERLFSKPTIITQKELAIMHLLEIRVKILDQSDIESLGWKSAGGYLNIKNFELSTGNAEKNTKENQWKLQLKEDNKIIIEQYRWMRFFGTIKNKSELKKLMQQLNIINYDNK